MRPTLTLRHYLEAPIAHSHEHAQLVFGLSGHLDLEVDGRGSQVRESSVMVLPFLPTMPAAVAMAAAAWCWMCPRSIGCCNRWVNTPIQAAACWINRRAWRWIRDNTNWCNGWPIARWMTH